MVLFLGIGFSAYLYKICPLELGIIFMTNDCSALQYSNMNNIASHIHAPPLHPCCTMGMWNTVSQFGLRFVHIHITTTGC